jgi:cytochrome c biogenesis protein CcmG/thiol:disulfide interchange protein DsbE
MKMSRRHPKPSKKTSNPILAGLAILGGLMAAGLLGIVILRAAFPATYRALIDTARQFKYQFKGLKAGSPAPDFTASTLEGKTYTLSQFRGQPVIVTFGASWCPDCREQAPMLNEARAKYPDLVILEISHDETETDLRQFIIDFQIEHPVMLDPGNEIYRRYQNFGIPGTFFIDAEGIICGRMVSVVTEANMKAGLKSIGLTE